MDSPEKNKSQTPPVRHVSARVFIFFSLAVLLTGVASLLFADLLWRYGWSASCTLLLVLFTLLFFPASFGCVSAVCGFVLLRTGGGRRITQLAEWRNRSIAGTSTALVFPTFNEDVGRVFAGLRAIHESLALTGEMERFDFFILSDTDDPDKWIEEERRWFGLARELNALGRIFYRHRPKNEGGKSGNVRDFLSAWGKRYRYFIVFDADSVMAGATIVNLVKLMEANPRAGLIQTAPALVNARSAFARMQQFANRLYGPIFFAGLNYWMQDGGNYWGHNAIVRTEPFMQFCDLPKLPGKKPFGGQILSHDFVEAALLRKENWEVWFAWDLDGSYEETPPSIIDNAKRDRRWCQGNLQHSLLLFARGLRGINRIHLTLGIWCYLTGPLWLLFLLTGTGQLWYQKHTGLSDIAVAAFTPFMRLGAGAHALLIFGLVMLVIFVPKFLGLLDLALDPQRKRAFGGFFRAAVSAFLETLFSTLHAPVQMLFHTKFVAATLFGFAIRWDSQQRGAGGGVAWRDALRQHCGHTALGIGWGALAYRLDPTSFWWFVPVLAGMVLSIPLSVVSSRKNFGEAFRRTGFFLTPEELAAPEVLARLRFRLQEEERANGSAGANAGLREAVIDPYVNAVHVSLLREKQAEPDSSESFDAPDLVRRLGEQVLVQDPCSLSALEQLAVLSDPHTMSWLHHEAWLRSPAEVADWCRAAIHRFVTPHND